MLCHRSTTKQHNRPPICAATSSLHSVNAAIQQAAAPLPRSLPSLSDSIAMDPPIAKSAFAPATAIRLASTIPSGHTPFSWVVDPTSAVPPSHTAFSWGALVQTELSLTAQPRPPSLPSAKYVLVWLRGLGDTSERLTPPQHLERSLRAAAPPGSSVALTSRHAADRWSHSFPSLLDRAAPVRQIFPEPPSQFVTAHQAMRTR